MKHYSVLSILAGISLFACTSIAYAQSVDVPRTISYQGAVTSTDGTPLFDGEHSITVTLYSDPAGTIPLWQDTYNATTSKGIFNLYLGTNKPLPSSTQMNRPLWVGTTINGGEEMRPLTPLAASPYALNLPDHAVTTDKLADGAVTAEKVEMDYVKGFRVNGQEVSGKGTVLDIRGGEGIALSYDETTGSLQIGQPQNSMGTHDDEKTGAAVQGSIDDAWGARGDLLDPGTHNHVTANNDDWIGTRDDYNFTIKVYDNDPAPGGTGRVMQYQPNAISANILGGHYTNSLGSGAGNIIAGGGSGTAANSIGNDSYATIAGGEGNVINTSYSAIGGGEGNIIGGDHSVIAGGETNLIGSLAYYSVISGGEDNQILSGSNSSNIGGGESNTISTSSISSTIAGGELNNATGNNVVIGGGLRNTVNASAAAVAGGIDNTIMGYNGLVAGGRNNTVNGSTGTIAGGFTNTVEAIQGFIGGGSGNSIEANASNSVIAGGIGNQIQPNATDASIGGGTDNEINPAPPNWTLPTPVQVSMATIPGGDNLIAQSWAQTVIGGWNLPKGAMPFRYQIAGADLLKKGPIFIIGNGDDEARRSNAFEVSYDGHSTVYDKNGTGSNLFATGKPAIRGTTYTDNVLYAWANVDPNDLSHRIGDRIQPLCDFGVAEIQYIGPGHYRVTMNLEQPMNDGSFAPMNLGCNSVTATIMWEGPMCASINTSQYNANSFDVFISRNVLVPAGPGQYTLDCDHTDLPFSFKVTGTPDDGVIP